MFDKVTPLERVSVARNMKNFMVCIFVSWQIIHQSCYFINPKTISEKLFEVLQMSFFRNHSSSKERIVRQKFSYFTSKTYFVGTYYKRLGKALLLSTLQYMFPWRTDKKY